MGRRDVRVLPDPAAVAEAVAHLVAERAAEAVGARAVFHVALAGGTTPLAAYRLLAASPYRDLVPWGRVEVWFGDERCVGECDPERNDLAAREALLAHVSIPPERLHPIPATAPDGAARYDALLRERVPAGPDGAPRLDLVLLGLGPDGHTASLFPGHPALGETAALAVRVDGAPKPPPSRVSLTLPLLRAARVVAFVVTGEGKRAALARVLSGDRSLPGACVDPPDGETLFFLDQEAAAAADPAAEGAAEEGS